MSMDLVGYNKCFLHLTNNKSTWKYARCKVTFSCSTILSNWKWWSYPKQDHQIRVGWRDSFGNSWRQPFPCLQWLMKGCNDNRRNSKEQYFNKKLCSTSAVTENVIGMFKVHWRLIYKKFECKLHNMKYFVMRVVLLHNLFIHTNDPCKPSWRISVRNL